MIARNTSAANETLSQDEKRQLDLRLDEELQGTFPASDPLKITRFSKRYPGAHRSRLKAAERKNDAKDLRCMTPNQRKR
jgi:hypothetical protein